MFFYTIEEGDVLIHGPGCTCRAETAMETAGRKWRRK
jgi:hypothetical protein